MYLYLLLLLLFSACDFDDPTKQEISIKIISEFQQPSYIGTDETCNNGWFEPINQTFTLLRIDLRTRLETTGFEQTLNLYTGPAQEFRVTNRKQRLFLKEISAASLGGDIVKHHLYELRVVFQDEIKGISRWNKNLQARLGFPGEDSINPCSGEFTLPCQEDDSPGECSVIYQDRIMFSKGRDYGFNLGVNWKKTVRRVGSTDVLMLAPTLTLRLGS